MNEPATRTIPDDTPPDWLTTQPERLAALDEYQILDTETERAFDELAFIASQVCDTPVALVSLVDSDRQWFKARVGFEGCETPIGQSVCKLGMASHDLLIIPDLSIDPRTRDNTLVTNEPEIRFYAGAPLITPDGTVVGMLCVIDGKPRPGGLKPDQERMLRGLAEQVISRMELRKSLILSEQARERERNEAVLLKRAADQLRFATEAGQFGAFELDVASGMVEVTAGFREIYGLDESGPVRGEDLAALRESGAFVSFDGIASNVAEGKVFDEYHIVRPNDAQRRWIERRGRVTLDADGQPAMFTGLIVDATDKRAVTEEIAHRLKNTLAIVQAVTRHTLRGVEDQGAVGELTRRLDALSTAHDVLMSHGKGESCLQDVAQRVLGTLGVEERVDIEGGDAPLGSRAVLQLTMLLHELGTNAMKYGALSNDDERITICLSRAEADKKQDDDARLLVIEWRENGGPPPVASDRRGLGIRMLERGLHPDGKVDIDFRETGLQVRITAPLSGLAA